MGLKFELRKSQNNITEVKTTLAAYGSQELAKQRLPKKYLSETSVPIGRLRVRWSRWTACSPRRESRSWLRLWSSPALRRV